MAPFFFLLKPSQVVEGSSAYKLLYHGLISEFLHKLLNLTQDIVLSLKQVLNLLESPVPETFRCPGFYCLFLDSFSQLQRVPKAHSLLPLEVQFPDSSEPGPVPASCLMAEVGTEGGV